MKAEPPAEASVGPIRNKKKVKAPPVPPFCPFEISYIFVLGQGIMTFEEGPPA